MTIMEPAPTVTMMPSQSPSAVVAGECTARPGPSSHPTPAHCAACRIPLNVPAHYHTVCVLCPLCQARHAADPQGANPYPVVPPIAKSTRTHGVPLTVAYTYPQLPSLAPSTSSPSPAGPRAPHPTTTSRTVHCPSVPRVCMRFGCGARLPERVYGDMCTACTHAGFARPRPPPPLPVVLPEKHVPKRTIERIHSRPREPLEFVRASLLRHADTVTEEEKDVEDELELVYPDDVPVETQYVSASSESEVKPMEDEDIELELLYPEDAVETAPKAPSKPHPPPTLRELFTVHLQAIPTPQHLAVLADKRPPRQCRMPGCNEVLPAHTCMERCIKCSLDHWKRRKMAAMGTSDSSRQPCTTSSPMAGTSMEATTTPDTVDIADGNGFPPTSSSPGHSRSNEPTDDHNIRQIPGWESDLTELSPSDSELESESDLESNTEPTRPPGDPTRLTIHIPLLFHRLPPERLLRKCGNKRCNIALPRDHRWKTCDPCRRAQSRYQKMRLENQRRSILGMELLESPAVPCRRWRSLSPEMRELDVTLTPETSRPCSTKRCRTRIPLPEVYQWKTCIACRARTRRKARRKRDALLAAKHTSCPPEVVPRFPAYQNQGVLLSSFDAQIKGYVEGQIMYLRTKLHEGEPRKLEEVPMVFVFVGEYSIVTGQRDECDGYDHDDSRLPNDLVELDAVREEVSGIVSELERVLRTTFKAGETFAIDKGGVILRFTCELELIAQLRPLTTPTANSETSAVGDMNGDISQAPTVPLVKTLSGELEAVIVPDESHRLFRGRRTVIRYCMFG